MKQRQDMIALRAAAAALFKADEKALLAHGCDTRYREARREVYAAEDALADAAVAFANRKNAGAAVLEAEDFPSKRTR